MVNPGYRQTEIGVIPEDWKVSTIADTAPLQRGFDLPTSKLEEGTIPVVYSNGIANYHSKAMVKGPGVVTGRSGTLGKVHFVDCDYWPHNTSLWVTNFRGNDERFIFYLYTAIGFERFSSGSGVPTLNRNDAHAFRLCLPPRKAEQEAIAGVLSDADTLIESLDALIVKKRQIKQGAMQELLTGNTRLPGFSGEWEEKRLDEVVRLINGRAYSLSEWETSGTPVIRLQNLTGRGDVYYYSNLALPEKQYCHSGDLLFMWSATFGPVLWLGPRAIFHYHIWRIECHPGVLSKEYLFHFLSDITDKLKVDSTSGGTMLHLTKTGMESMRIQVPSFAEQSAIATVLSDMDAEITALETKLAKARQIKQGMMQELLAGRIRLV